MNKKISFPIALIIITALAVIVVGVILAYQYWWVQKPVACTMETKVCPDGSAVGRIGPNCEFAPCPNIKVDETAGWQTYRNEKYGYEIKYPSDWSYRSVDEIALLTAEGSQTIIYCDYFGRGNKPCQGLENVGIGDVGPSVDINIMKTSLEEFKKDWVIEKQEDYLLDGIKGYKIFGGPIMGIGWDYNVIFVIKNNNNYIITYPDFESLPMQNQILSTFKFLK